MQRSLSHRGSRADAAFGTQGRPVGALRAAALAVSLVLLLLCGCSGIRRPPATQTIAVETDAAPIGVQRIECPVPSHYDAYVGNRVSVQLTLEPGSISEQALSVTSLDPSVVTIEDITLTPLKAKTLLRFTFAALSTGSTRVEVRAKIGSAAPQTISISVEAPPKISRIDSAAPPQCTLAVQESHHMTYRMTPSGLTVDDFQMQNSRPEVLSISEIAVTDDGAQTKLTFAVQALAAGDSAVTVSSADGKTHSLPTTFSVQAAETEPTVTEAPEKADAPGNRSGGASGNSPNRGGTAQTPTDPPTAAQGPKSVPAAPLRSSLSRQWATPFPCRSSARAKYGMIAVLVPYRWDEDGDFYETLLETESSRLCRPGLHLPFGFACGAL